MDAPPTYRSTRRWRGPAIAAAAALIVVLAIAVPLLLGGGQDAGPIADTTPTTVPATTVPPPATTEPSTPAATVESWQLVGADVLASAFGLLDMTSIESGLIAVGIDIGEEDFRPNGAVFTSEDGVTWIRQAEDDPALTMGAVFLYGITEGGPGLVAVGMGCEDDTQACSAYATAWTSIDGTSWSRTPHDADAFGDLATETTSMSDVIATDDGLVAVGAFQDWTIDEDGAVLGISLHPTAWTSPDGLIWERSWQGEGSNVELSALGDARADMYAVIEGADGLVAVGSTLDENGDSIAAVWTSPDGIAWERVDPTSPAFGPGTIMTDVTWGSGGFVAVGTEGGTEAAVWQSPDGRSWTRVDTTDQPFDTTGTLSSVAELESGYIALGPHLLIGPGVFEGENSWVTLWTSTDGANWDRVHAMGAGYGSEVVVTDSGIVVAGLMVEDEELHAAAWAGPAFDPAAPPPDPQPPAPIPDEEEDEGSSGLEALEEGLSCDELATMGFSYAEAVAYWMRYGMPTDLDPDDNGIPCETEYPETDVADVFGGPDALAVHIVTDLREGTFAATGPAVDAGIICAAGTNEFAGDVAPGPGALFRWEDLYTCDDATGTFILGADVFIGVDNREYGVWSIVGGTGSYESLLAGGGSDSLLGVSDDLTGRVTIGSQET